MPKPTTTMFGATYAFLNAERLKKTALYIELSEDFGTASGLYTLAGKEAITAIACQIKLLFPNLIVDHIDDWTITEKTISELTSRLRLSMQYMDKIYSYIKEQDLGFTPDVKALINAFRELISLKEEMIFLDKWVIVIPDQIKKSFTTYFIGSESWNNPGETLKEVVEVGKRNATILIRYYRTLNTYFQIQTRLESNLAFKRLKRTLPLPIPKTRTL